MIVLNEDLDIEQEFQERFASVVSLSPESYKESNGIDFDEGEDKADAGRGHREVEEEAEEDEEDAAAVADMKTTATVTAVKNAEDYDVDGGYETDSKFKSADALDGAHTRPGPGDRQASVQKTL